jgi:hypothetical protein
MTFPNRLAVVGILAVLALLVYGAATHYSEELVSYVVEQALLQKLPPDSDSDQAINQFRHLLSTLPSRQAKLEKLIYLSQYLEKLQILTPQELDQLLRKDSSSPWQGRS